MSLIAQGGAGARLSGWMCAMAMLLPITGSNGYAQDLFEVHVLEYEMPKPGAFTLETHLAGPARPAAGGAQGFHFTEELTGGVTGYFSLGVMELNAVAGSGALKNAGWRLVPHLYLPPIRGVPFRTGLTVEFSFQKAPWSTASRSVELIPVLEAEAGRVQIDVNPSFHKPLVGTGGLRWEFGLGARAALHNRSRFTPSLEYYGTPGFLTEFSPLQTQVHAVFPGADIRLSRRLLVNAGIGFGLTGASDPVTLKARVQFEFGRERGP